MNVQFSTKAYLSNVNLFFARKLFHACYPITHVNFRKLLIMIRVSYYTYWWVESPTEKCWCASVLNDIFSAQFATSSPLSLYHTSLATIIVWNQYVLILKVLSNVFSLWNCPHPVASIPLALKYYSAQKCFSRLFLPKIFQQSFDTAVVPKD